MKYLDHNSFGCIDYNRAVILVCYLESIIGIEKYYKSYPQSWITLDNSVSSSINEACTDRVQVWVVKGLG